MAVNRKRKSRKGRKGRNGKSRKSRKKVKRTNGRAAKLRQVRTHKIDDRKMVVNPRTLYMKICFKIVFLCANL